MPENILVIEYEHGYAERVRQALIGQPFAPHFAANGDEALRELDTREPRLIVLSSVVPNVSTADLIRVIRQRKTSQATPILLTVAGYSGRSPKQDAARVGASDILPKPYTEAEFLGKVQQLLGIGQLTSSEIFGDLLSDEEAIPAGATKRMNPKDDVDKMIADTLSGVRPQKKSATSPGSVPVPPKPRTAPGSADIDKMLHDTLSGLEKRKPASTPPPPPVPAPPAAVPVPLPAVTPSPAPPKIEIRPAEKVPVSQPIFTPAVPETPREEEEPTDGIRFGQYVLLEKIATGGMAEVWKARMRGVEGFQKIVAIKKILPHLSDNQEFIGMFVDEAKLAAQLNHNSIIHIYDLGKIQSSYYIAMEYVDGSDLKTILKQGQDRDQPLGVELSLFITSKLAAALDYAHRKRDFDEKELGLVHRDVSPQNVLISQEGDIKLCDFGIAKAASKASHTQAGALKGKLQYMSPEQAWGKNIDRRSDVFALGAVLFEMLTGRKLFLGDNEISILDQVRDAKVMTPSELDDEITPDIDRIVLKALSKEPSDRYQTAGEMAREIDSVLYNFRPTPTSADLAIYMHRIWNPEPARPVMDEEPPAEIIPQAPITPIPVPAPTPVVKPARIVAAPAAAIAAADSSSAMPSWDRPALSIPEGKKRSLVGPIALAVVVLAAAGAGYFFFRSRGAQTTVPQTASSPAAGAAGTPTSAPGTLAALDTAATMVPTGTLTATDGTVAAAPVLDSAMVNQEVQKRLAAERARLDAAQAGQPQATTTRAAQTPPPVARPEPPQVTQTVAPPVETPPTATQAATQTVAETVTAAPTDSAPAVQRAREGDLMQSNAGVTPARVLEFGKIAYPPMARAQRVEGTVLMSVLVSETGQVLATRMIKGINRPGGLNEAAEQIVRRSKFSAPMKDGVRVKAWTTVPVKFAL